MRHRFTRTPWAHVARGAAALAFGILILSRPTMTVATFVALFAALAVCDGVAGAWVALRFRRRGGDASALADPLFLLGAGGAATGVAAAVWPDLTMQALLALVAAWALVTGAGHLYAVARAGERPPGWHLLGVAGGTALALAAFVALNLARGDVRVGRAVGLYGIAAGATLLAFACRVYVARAIEPRRRAADAPAADGATLPTPMVDADPHLAA
jgi:uncharacterized membrane protein HdeD (DUF308 family)